jgi:hypothetical protein
MAIYNGAPPTAEVTTGNVTTTYDVYSSTAGTTYGAKAPVGALLYDAGDLVGGYTFPSWGKPTVYKYVWYNSATNPALIARPGVVYFISNDLGVVSGTEADGLTGTTSDAAGIMMVNTTALSSLTATILNNSGSVTVSGGSLTAISGGSWVWIAVGGYVKGANAPGSTAVGDQLYGTSGNFTLARVAVSNSTGGVAAPLFATAITAVSSNASDMDVRLVGV